MVILHIAYLDTSILGGVQIAVPKMVKAQGKFATAALLNVQGDCIDDVNCFNIKKNESITSLPEPYNKPDLVVFHEIYRKEYIKLYKNVVHLGIPYVIIPHGCLSKSAQKKKFLKKVLANFLLFNAFIRNANYVQYLSENEKQMSIYKDIKSVVLGNGIEVPNKYKTHFSDDEIVITYIGRLDIIIKGIDLLLDAIEYSSLLFEKKNVSVKIYGPDYDSAHDKIMQMIEERNISNFVTLNKEIVGSEKENVLLNTDFFIQTSRTEGLPMGLLEALSYGLPCIVTQGTGLAELIESRGAGFYCDISAESIRSGIERAIDAKGNAMLYSVAARNLILEKFDNNKVAYDSVKKYENIANEQLS